eukprot:12855_1
MAERQGLKDRDDERTEDTQIITPEDKVCCGCCSVFGAFYGFSIEYIIVAIVMVVMFVSFIGDLPDESWWILAIIIVAAISRLLVGILGIYMTMKLSDSDPNNTPSESLINFWTFLMLWIPIIFNSLWIFFTTALVLALTTVFGSSDSLNFEQMLLIGLFQAPPIIDMIMAITFYVMVNKFIEKTTQRNVYACPMCSCC